MFFTIAAFVISAFVYFSLMQQLNSVLYFVLIVLFNYEFSFLVNNLQLSRLESILYEMALFGSIIAGGFDVLTSI